ncbi:MAG: coproporphyrinogen-III oxidase [Lysobacteraceae bacterium]|nr:MAG: coproporphyrinogen-III oxidase [Xanthomonadaceae bacterium]
MTAAASVEFDSDLIRRYDNQGPRYTSYPTAASFTTEFDASKYTAQALASNDLPIPPALSIYAHIPFCEQLCYYCGCNKIVTRHKEKCAPYLQTLLQEAKLQGSLFDSDREVVQLHFGGGTPTYLSDDQLYQLMSGLSENFSFAGPEKREFSIEIDPRTVDANRISRLTDMGFNRVSMGIQDFDARVQIAVNREQSFDSVEQLFIAARETDIRSLSIDLIYGLPHQTVRSFHNTLELVSRLRPDRISIYNYAHLPHRFKSQRLIRSQDLPDATEKLALLNLCVTYLCAEGYEYIGMDHFALPNDELCVARDDGTMHRNFQGYSTRRGLDLIGLGVSAISSVGRCFAQNQVKLQHYSETVNNGHLAIAKGLTIDDDDLMRAEIIDHLMCYSKIPVKDFESRWKIKFNVRFESALSRLTAMTRDGLLETTDDGYQITPRGRMLLRPIAMCFDAHLSQGTTPGFSKVI